MKNVSYALSGLLLAAAGLLVSFEASAIRATCWRCETHRVCTDYFGFITVCGNVEDCTEFDCP